MIRQYKDPKQWRFELVRYARKHGVKPAARYFNTTPKTVRKWLKCWEPGSMRGLTDQSSSYNLWFNVARKNRYKSNRTPWEIAKEKNSKLNSNIPVLPPVFLDKLYFQRTSFVTSGGYDVIPHL
ncbi:helix-turn-helix domain-containing protein [bacterium]|nr:helix-turn-helix domain-containing protein [bacterium]